jgi:Ca-activated chloride channel homolog
MKAATQSRSTDLQVYFLLVVTLALLAMPAAAVNQIVLSRGDATEPGEYKGVVDLTVNPGIENAKVSITVDGQHIADSLQSPYRVVVDFGPTAVEHKIAVTVVAPNKRRIKWVETINKGMLPLTVKVTPIDLSAGLFEAKTTAPNNDPVAVVELWDSGKRIAAVSEEPYRFVVPVEILASGFVQVTAKAKSGEEAADFWSSAGDIHVESIQVRTVPIFVSVVDRNGQTLDNVDRSLFRIMDNDAVGTIVEFGKAFDQPISIALLLDASASMTYSMERAIKAAQEFAQRTLKAGDSCSVFAIQDVPRRKQPLTGDIPLVAQSLSTIQPAGRTALYDAINSAIRELKEQKTRRAIVILTDGGDTSSMASFEDAEKSAAQAGIPIYFIAYDTGNDTQLRDIERLKHLAAQTGGFVAVATQQNLQARYADIERDLRAQFAITYKVTDYARANEWRRVRVTLASPKLSARTIRGYFAQ